jgi:aspartyl-tRNA(Asn)/glutamyl-tRNA(Gln) amidotransferase subunit B
MTAWETVIGLEVHCELATGTKLFCGCPNDFGAEPNTYVCPVCLGLPGSLPVLNSRAVEFALRVGEALHCDIPQESIFHRKNYFYPDMPKNYQISQYDLPICVGGHLEVDLPDGTTKRVGITRVHMEEDTGKTEHGSESGRIHDAQHALVDYNRAGVPLVECVSEPDMRSPDEAAAYLRELRATLEALEVSDVKMEEGSLRCDANVSLRPVGTETLGTKVEIKNMNSIRSLERALTFEIARQTKALENGEPVVQETRHWDEDAGATKSMRSKEEAFDYRYFPEPDIPALEPSDAWIEEIRGTLPELPRARRVRYVDELGLKPDTARVLVADRASTSLFEESCALGADPVVAANWITQDVAALRNAAGGDGELSPRHIADLTRLLAGGSLSGAGAKQALERAFATGDSLSAVVDALGLAQISDPGSLRALVDEVLAEHPDEVERFRGGKEALIGFFLGQLIKKTGGSANPSVARELLLERLQG